MNTPAHLIVGAAAFGKPDIRWTLPAATAGAFAPDLSLYAMTAYSIWVASVPPEVVFGQYYYSDEWQSVFAVDNSFIFWGLALAVAIWRKMPILLAFSGAGFLHLLFDFPLHTHDVRMHFWPVTDWVFVSSFSYWDSTAYAGVVGPAALLLTLALAVLLFRRFKTVVARGWFALLAALELASSGIWRVFF